MQIIVVGHKNPDTDSIVSAIVWAEYLKSQGKDAKAYRAGDLNFETKFVLEHFEEPLPEMIGDLDGKEVFLVDHGELAQSPDGIEKVKIVGVLDHHRLGGIQSMEPVYYRSEPIGSTSSLVAKIFNETGKEIDKKRAFLLLAGIISDTLKLTSPTTTEEDKKIAEQLVKITGIDIGHLANQMFGAKSSLAGMEIDEILQKDYKEFEFNSTKVGIGVYETVSAMAFESMEDKVFGGLRALKEKRQVDLMYFAVVDILKHEGFIYLIGDKEKEMAQKAFGGEIKDNVMHVPGLVSRKKQMVPVLAKLLEHS
jgi:manganese-dependent inorganic pyrophosphatase